MTVELSPDQQKLLAYLLQSQTQKHTQPVTPAPINPAHGAQGLLSSLGLRPGISNAVVMPNTGLYNRLPKRPNRDINPLYGILTGIDPGTGAEPVDECDPTPIAGPMKLCTQTQVFGWVGRATQVISLKDVNNRVNRGEFEDQTLIGSLYGGPGVQAPAIPGTPTSSQAMINSEVGKKLTELWVEFVRTMAPDVYTGNPANNTAGGGREYYKGLELLIKTGHVDAVDGVTPCPAADSIVADAIVDYGIADVNVNSLEFVNAYTSIWQRLQSVARDTGLDPATIVIVMRSEQFYEAAKVVPCANITYRCANIQLPAGGTLGANSQLNMSAAEAAAMTTDMLADWINMTGQYLPVDGIKVPVIIDDTIPFTVPLAGQRASTMYFVPLTVRGGSGSRPVSEGGNVPTYFDYFPMNGGGINSRLAAARAMAPADSYSTSRNGMYLFHKVAPKGVCNQIEGWTQQRLMLETPQLAAKLTNVTTAPTVISRNWDPAGPDYVDGGVINYAPPSYTP